MAKIQFYYETKLRIIANCQSSKIPSRIIENDY